MPGQLKYLNDFSKAEVFNKLWYKATATTAVLVNNNAFAAIYTYVVAKIAYGLKHSLALVRKRDDDAIFRDSGADAGKVTLDKISSIVPHVVPADSEKFSI